MRYATFAVNGDVERRDAARTFLAVVDGLAYLPPDTILAEFEEKVSNLERAHEGMNNFYNEPPHAKALLELVPVTGAIPDAIRTRYVRTLIRARIGNGHGLAWNTTLYRDPRDLRLWEHTYLQREMHGGGPPQLRVIARHAGQLKYGDLSGSLNERDDHGMTPLLSAVMVGDVERVRTLLEQGADPNRTASDGTTALWLAEDDFGLTEVARVLRQFGATKK